MNRDLEDNLIGLEDSIGNVTQAASVKQNRNTNIDTSRPFSPIKGIQHLPQSVPGHTLFTREDQEITSEMWLKASLDLSWEETGYIPREALINHLKHFTFRSKAISHFMIDRLSRRELLYPSEIEQLGNTLELQGIQEEIGYTPGLNRLDRFLFGDHNWNGAPHQSIGIAERRYLIWVTHLTPRDRILGWGQEDWKNFSPKDLKLFFAVLFNYPMSFAMTFYISLKQLTEDQFEHRMGMGGLYSIEPTAFLNMLQIIVIAKNLKFL